MNAAPRPLAGGHRPLATRAVAFAGLLMLVTAATTAAALLLPMIWGKGGVGLAAPFAALTLCLLAVFAAAAALIRRAARPLDALAQHAARLLGQGRAEPLELCTGDEFEGLADAFNTMSSRLEVSLRRMQEIAFVDAVTQLPNQDGFRRELESGLLRAGGDNRTAVVAVFELRRLAKLIQTLAPDAARDFVRALAQRFAEAVRARAQGGGVIVARLGADRLAAFVPELDAPAEASRFIQQVTAALNQPFEWRGHKLLMGARGGGALAPRDGRSAEDLVRRAALAAAAADASPTQSRLFAASLDRAAASRLTLEREMRGALERNEFRAYFQPKLSLRSGRIEACEALARWVRGDRAIVGPGRFIPVAEESGLIGPLSDAILREACWKAAAWARAGHAAKVAVNVSALQFRSERFAENVLRTVAHAGLAANSLELEITESVAVEDPERTARVIQPLRAAGVRLAIDDFGCGHSSLAALSKLPFDVIKIDQQFVRALERGDPQAAAIIDMILALARTLNMEVVAEGVERRAEAEFMAARGCQWAQGFLYGAAVTAAEFAEALRRQAEEENATAA